MARKQFKIPEPQMERLKEFADLTGTSVSAVLAEWIASFVKNGSDYVRPTLRRVETSVPHSTLEAAEEKALLGEHTLRDVILFEIDEINKM